MPTSCTRPAASRTSPPRGRTCSSRTSTTRREADLKLSPNSKSPASRRALYVSGLINGEPSAMHQFSRQAMTDNAFGQLATGDQLVDVETRLDSHLLAHEDEVLGANIARS